MNFKILVNLFLILAAEKFRTCEALDPFELDEFLSSVFTNRAFSGVWMSGNAFHYRDSFSGDVLKFDVSTLSSEAIFSNTVLESYTSASYTISPDQNYVLIRYNPQSVYRHSTTAQYTIYDLQSGQYYPIGNEKHLQFAQWAPVGHGLVYVYENNVYYVSSPTSAAVQISNDGVPDVIYNGVPDWVYEEEVLSSGSALWFSPQGDRLAFAFFNDTEVPEFTYYVYGSYDPADQYPNLVNLRYPKVNAINPDFELRVVTLSDPTNIKSIPILESDQVSRDYVLFGVTWATNDEVVAVVENRIQNEAVVKRCNVGGDTCDTEYSEKEENGWLEFTTPVYNSDGTKCLMILSQPVDDDTYQHLVLYDTATKQYDRLTTLARVVTSIRGWDEARNLVYYYGSYVNTPSQQHLYSVDLNSGSEPVTTCITCSFNTPEGFCRYGSASFSTDYSYFAETCSGPGPNYVTINNADDLEWAMVYENNTLIRTQLAEKLIPEIKDFEIPVEGGFIARARLLCPPGMDTSGVTKYPMIVYVYAGPDSNQITDRFSTGFQNYAVTNRQYIYAYIDGRGSGRKGDKMRFQLYKKMGTVEIEDQIAVTKALRDSLLYIDPDRIGIWGWSYGGFATALVLIQDTEHIFNFGLSVAPVTDFRLYDTIYTERYMGLSTPEDNEGGYNNTDIMRRVEGLRDRSFFLVHGNADDNVHYQQSMLLAKALEHADILFYQMSYPDENHALNNVYPHLYHSIDRYFARCFGLPDPVYRHFDFNLV